jgi:hypothetical protein
MAAIELRHTPQKDGYEVCPKNVGRSEQDVAAFDILTGRLLRKLLLEPEFFGCSDSWKAGEGLISVVDEVIVSRNGMLISLRTFGEGRFVDRREMFRMKRQLSLQGNPRAQKEVEDLLLRILEFFEEEKEVLQDVVRKFRPYAELLGVFSPDFRAMLLLAS